MKTTSLVTGILACVCALPAAAGDPELHLLTSGRTGDPVNVTVLAPIGAQGFLFIDADRAITPLTGQTTGWIGVTSALILVPVSIDGTGSWQSVLQLPLGVEGTQFHSQAILWHPGAGLISTNASVLTVKGDGTPFRLEETSWGRAARMVDASGRRLRAEAPIHEDLLGIGVGLDLVHSPAAETSVLRLWDLAGNPSLDAEFFPTADGEGLVVIDPVGFPLPAGAEPPVWPRDALLRMRFSHPVDPATLAGIRIEDAGGAAVAVRLRVDPFDPRIVTVDPLIGRADAVLTGLAHNPAGLPEGASGIANLVLRLPTEGGLTDGGGSPLDAALETVDGSDIVRALRSGGANDPHQGYVRDPWAPVPLSEEAVTIAAADGPYVDFLGDGGACSGDARPGDVLHNGSGVWEVVEWLPAPPPLKRARVALLGGQPPAPGFATRLVPFLIGDDPGCFFTVAPPQDDPDDPLTTRDITVGLLLSDAVDPGSLSGLEALLFTTGPDPSDAGALDRIVGEVRLDAPDRPVFVPAVRPEGHVAPGPDLVAWATGALQDKSGGALVHVLSHSYEFDPVAGVGPAWNLALDFDAQDMDPDGLVDLAGQAVLEAGRLRGRDVIRFSAIVDDASPLNGPVWAAFEGGVQAPLVPLGSRLQTVWRYLDLGLSLESLMDMNLDVEGLYWAPDSGTAVADVFPRLRIDLSHGTRVPDEEIDNQSLLPVWPDTGLDAGAFAANASFPLDAAGEGDPITVVDGLYLVDPLDAVVAGANAHTYQPYGPLQALFTWRDTRLDPVSVAGGPAGPGLEPGVLHHLGETPAPIGWALPGSVPSAGLPLLMDFSCYPDASGLALGLNSQRVFFTPAAPTPYKRVHSSGGLDSTGQPIVVDPDTSLVPLGGFQLNGLPTEPGGPETYWGMVDFVTRVSVVHSRFYAIPPGATAGVQVLDDLSAPDGTDVQVAFRGALLSGGSRMDDASALDPYGRPPGATGALGPWTTDPADLAGFTSIQFRFILEADVDEAEPTVPSLGGFGFALGEQFGG